MLGAIAIFCLLTASACSGFEVWGSGLHCFGSDMNLRIVVALGAAKTQRVQVPHSWVLGFGVIVIVVKVLGKYMINRYLDP